MISTCWLNPQFLNLVKNWKIWKDWILTELFYEIFIPRKIFNKNSQIVVHIKILNTLQRECIRMYKSAKTPPARGHFWTRLDCTLSDYSWMPFRNALGCAQTSNSKSIFENAFLENIGLFKITYFSSSIMWYVKKCPNDIFEFWFILLVIETLFEYDNLVALETLH